MIQTRVSGKTKDRRTPRYMTNVISKSKFDETELQEADTPQILTKIMFYGLAVTSVVLFYLAISSLML